jgi:hypothetical protein
MKHLHRRAIWGWVMALVIALAWGAQGAPIMPDQHRGTLNEEIDSLAGIDRVQFTLADLPKSLTARGLKKSEVRRRCINRITKDGIEVEDNPQLPRIDLWFKDIVHPLEHTSLGFVSVVAVFQSVRVNRLNRDLTVPTACFAGVTLTGKGMLIEDAARQLVRRCGNVAQVIARADPSGRGPDVERDDEQ